MPYYNPELCRIIRDFAYNQGRVRKILGLLTTLQNEKRRIEARLAQLPGVIYEVEEALNLARAESAELQARARRKEPKLPIEDIRPIVHTPRRGTWKRGEFKRELVKILKEANGTPLSTRQIMDHCAEKFGIVEERGSRRNRHHGNVIRRLREMADKGVVQKLPCTQGTLNVYWVWIGLE